MSLIEVPAIDDLTARPTALPPARKPELLAPAGDETCLRAAVENGADAVYFGLQAHNARARAANFALEDLPGIAGFLHARGVRGYVTLNVLAFPSELDELERIVRAVAEAGIDAVIVQDIGLCRLIRAITPDLEIHASTQMSVTSVEGVKLAAELGCSRVILARELSVREVAAIARHATVPLEVFVHGALCVAYSGQCLTSEALGGRSANRGECAQACRMPYEIVCDGELRPLGDVKYLLSPKDLAAYDLIPSLVNAGVSSLKIEGRLKTPEYVATITASYRKAIDEAVAGRPARFDRAEIDAMELTFSRGFSHGFLDGNDHKVLVRGDYAKKRGLFLGRVDAVRGDRVRLSLHAPLKPGDGVVFDADEARGLPEQGGRVYQVEPVRRGRAPGGDPRAPSSPASAGVVELGFGRGDINLSALRPGQRLWKTDDPELTRRVRASYEGPPHRTVALDLTVRAVVGSPLVVEGRAATGLRARIEADAPLATAEKHPATSDDLRAQVDRLGGTIYHLGMFTCEIEGAPLVPRSQVNAMRRALVEALEAQAKTPRPRWLSEDGAVASLRQSLRDRSAELAAPVPATVELAALCRTAEQAMAAARAGAATIHLDFHHPKTHAPAISELRKIAPNAVVFVATPRIEKPDEANLFKFLARQGADGLLVRNAGGLAFCASRGVPFVADFSLNAANELSVEFLVARGARRVTASYDLSFEQLDDLLRAVPPRWLEVVIHQHMPMFHMEHCVFCAFLSPGTDRTNCGRPCDRHEVKLRDRTGMEHPLQADVGCRNTLFNAVPQTAAEYLPRLIERGARSLRVEFLEEDEGSVGRVLGLYRDAIDGRRPATKLWKDLKATNRYGVTRGQLAVL
jgi:putative protease